MANPPTKRRKARHHSRDRDSQTADAQKSAVANLVLGSADEIVPKLLRLEDGYWEQLVAIAAELSALRLTRVGVNGLIREVLIEALALRPVSEIQERHEAARQAYEGRVAEIEAKITAGKESKLSVRDRMFYKALTESGASDARGGQRAGRPRKGRETASLD